MLPPGLQRIMAIISILMAVRPGQVRRYGPFSLIYRVMVSRAAPLVVQSAGKPGCAISGTGCGMPYG